MRGRKDVTLPENERWMVMIGFMVLSKVRNGAVCINKDRYKYDYEFRTSEK